MLKNTAAKSNVRQWAFGSEIGEIFPIQRLTYSDIGLDSTMFLYRTNPNVRAIRYMVMFMLHEHENGQGCVHGKDIET
jgi:hypothetical protein